VSIKVELKQLFHEDANALLPVKNVPKDWELLKGHMFTVEKYDAVGNYEKTKSRLVADGSTQDRAVYPDKSPPTVAMHSLYTILAFYAGMSMSAGYLMGKVDVKGAFVQTPMVGTDVYMRIRKKIVAYLLIMYRHFAEYVQPDGLILTKLLKAIYGCVQAEKLWYDLLTKVLRSRGYVPSETDPCVMR
jgi:hypothetical protein